METREYHIVRSGFGTNGAGSYYWIRTDGFCNTSNSYDLYPKQADCIRSAKADAKRLNIKPIVIR